MGYVCRDIACSNNKIFVLDSYKNLIYVYSYEEKLITSWSKSRYDEDFWCLFKITAFQNIVFIIGVGIPPKIQIFTHYGKLISEYEFDNLINVSSMTISDNYVYVGQCDNHRITKYKLIYD